MIHAAQNNLEHKIDSLRILDNNPQKPVVRMANLCVLSAHSVRNLTLGKNILCIFFFYSSIVVFRRVRFSLAF